MDRLANQAEVSPVESPSFSRLDRGALLSGRAAPTREQIDKLTEYITRCLDGKIPFSTYGERDPISWKINGGTASIHSHENGMQLIITKNGKSDSYRIFPDMNDKMQIEAVNNRSKINRTDYENALFALKQCPFRE